MLDRSTRRFMPGGVADGDCLPKGPEGRALCRWCNLEVPKGRRTFCSDWCVHEWRMRTDASYLRELVFRRDRGVCARCGLDCVREWGRIRRLRWARRCRVLAEWGVKARHRRSLWDADHIVPVVEGGGECDLANLRTLCLKCHSAVTAELRERRQSPARAPSSAQRNALTAE